MVCDQDVEHLKRIALQQPVELHQSSRHLIVPRLHRTHQDCLPDMRLKADQCYKPESSGQAFGAALTGHQVVARIYDVMRLDSAPAKLFPFPVRRCPSDRRIALLLAGYPLEDLLPPPAPTRNERAPALRCPSPKAERALVPAHRARNVSRLLRKSVVSPIFSA